MLTLTRKHDEELVIYDTISHNKIRLRVHNINSGSAKISIDAPQSVIIDRKEVYDTKSLDNYPESVRYAQ